MESAYVSKYIFEFKLQFYKDVVDLHYKLLNILSLICFDTGNYYCFCTKYKGCEEEYNAESRLCSLCRIPIHFNNFEEFLDRNQFHLVNLKKYARKLYALLLEYYDVDKTSLEAFSVEYSYLFRYWNSGETTSSSLRELIENLTEIKKINKR